MADRDPARTPVRDPDVSPDVTLTWFRDYCQDQAARFTMQPADYEVYSEITWNFSFQLIPYHEFRQQMGVVLHYQKFSHGYAHLRVCWDVFHREFIGEVRMVDNPLFMYPVYLCRHLNLNLDFALFGDSIRNRAFQRLDERARELRLQLGYIEAGQRARELKSMQHRRYRERRKVREQARKKARKSPDGDGGGNVDGA